MKITAKLMNIQQKLIAPKNNYNSFGKYSYRSCEDILEAVKPLLAENKVVLTICDEIILVGERFYIKAIATLTDCESDETISNVAYAREEDKKSGMSESQITGSCSSYARKYALNGLFCIDDVKDADTRDNREKTTETTIKKKTPTAADKKALNDLVAKCKEDNVSIEKICEVYKVATKEELTKAYIDNALNNWDKVKSRCS